MVFFHKRVRVCIVIFLVVFNLISVVAVQSSVHASSTISKTYSFGVGWGSSKKTYKLNVEIPIETYNYYTSISHPWSTISYSGHYEFHLTEYVIPDSLGNIPQTIALYTNGGEEEIADAVLSFVQDIGYVSGNYQLENTLYPIETLVMGGVCDDLSALYATMMKALGFEVIFLHFTSESHVCVGIHLSTPPQHAAAGNYNYWTYENKQFYTAETTSEGWLVGEIGEDLNSAYIEWVTPRYSPNLPPASARIDEYSIDTDGDGLSDGAERNTYHTNPYNADTDGDGLSDYYEIFVSHTDPLKGDSDNDGLNDGREVSIGTNPLKADTDDDMWNDSIDPMPTNFFVPNFIIVAGVGATVVLTVFIRRKRHGREAAPPTPLAPTFYCPICQNALVFMTQYQRWYCQRCQRYV